ncbi:MAG: hypothetical protein ACXWZM_11345, partial [Solirubrobacterales bacterium]
AAIAAFAALACYVVSVLIEQGTGVKTDGPENRQLLSFDQHSGTLLLATVIRSLGFAAICLPLYYLFRAAQARSEKVRSEMVGFAFIGPAILAVQGILAWAASRGISSDFIDSGTNTVKAAKDLIDASGIRNVASALLIPAVLGLMVAMIYIPLQAYRVGLVTRFSGTLAMALGASMFLIFPVALLGILCWLVFVGLIFIDKLPFGSRPPAWDAGKAIPWEGSRRGAGGGLFGGPQQPAPPGGDDTVETGGVETTGTETSPASNPSRQRGERRKRKRRQ